MNDVSRIYQTQAGAARDGRCNLGVDELKLGVVDSGLVRFKHAFELSDRRTLGIELLFGDDLLLPQHLVAIQVHFRIGQLSLVPRELTFGCSSLNLIRPWIDFRDNIALLHQLPFLEMDRHQLAIHAALPPSTVASGVTAPDPDVDTYIAGSRFAATTGIAAAPLPSYSPPHCWVLLLPDRVIADIRRNRSRPE